MTQTQSEPILIDAAELARLTGMKPRSVYRYHVEGRVPAGIRPNGVTMRKDGRRASSSLRWRRADIEAWIAAGCPQPARDFSPKRTSLLGALAR